MCVHCMCSDVKSNQVKVSILQYCDATRCDELVDRLFSFMVSLMLYNNIIIYLGTQGYIIGIYQQIKGNLEPVFIQNL